MALSATLHRFQIELADIDRGVYDSLDLRVARHPSEDAERVVVRVLARALAHEEGLEFGRGLSTVEDAALWTRSPHGEITTWIDVGIPAAERLHRASKRAGRVLVVTHKPEMALRQAWSSREIHRAEAIEVIQLDPSLVAAIADPLDRTESWYVTVQDGLLSVARDERSCDGALRRSPLSHFVDGAA
ncbi:MAG: YaeQ family protein [Myxococcota bacterium]